MKFSIVKSSKECLYTSVSASEWITTSLFILDGTELKARMTVQGPIASATVSSSAEVLAAALRYDKSGKDLALNIDTDVNFEELYDNLPEEANSWDDDYYYDQDDFSLGDTDDDVDDAMFEELYYVDDDDEYEFLEDDSMDDIEIADIRKAKAERDSMDEAKRREMKEQRLENRRKKFEAAKAKKDEAKRKAAEKKKRKATISKMNQKKKLGLDQLRKGEPFQKTYQIEKEGWYRYCIAATASLVSS